ncbi:hypothetical protein NQ318_014320 [Aromia moschata]|uniref:Uncharacterized protein n=1 Tax=Aromia moschata TaxID=1265417 RepID=A0AAV8Z0K2_9CUCU|nr:hypothetical protein NQ318_014320 [Aromia moschata]
MQISTIITQKEGNLIINFAEILGETGSFSPKMDEDGILIRVSENPCLSTRRLSAKTGLSESSICRIF